MEENAAFAQHAIDAGAIGFVLKDTADTELPEAVRLAARRQEYVSPRVAGQLLARRQATGDALHVH
jgi:DNA-binding NarL/FixJ family response regulator